MGKISFPLINVRKDVTTKWHMKHYTGPAAEIIQVPESADEYGYYTTFLVEVPDSGTATKSVTTTPPKISGLVEFRGSPVDEKTLRLLLSPTQFYVNYQTGQLLFHPSQAGQTFKVDYWGKGSLVEADDVNWLHQQILRLEKEHVVPEFLEFGVDSFPTTLEVGQSFPSTKLPQAVKFSWKLRNSEGVQPRSIKIIQIIGSNEKILAEGISSEQTSVSVDFTENLIFINPQTVIFRILASATNGSSTQTDLEVRWVDRLRWGTSSSPQDATDNQIQKFGGSYLLPPNLMSKKITFSEDSQTYKVVVTPKRRPIRKVVDTKSNLEVVFASPIEKVLTNDFGLAIPSLIYGSSYPISSEVTAKIIFEKTTQDTQEEDSTDE